MTEHIFHVRHASALQRDLQPVPPSVAAPGAVPAPTASPTMRPAWPMYAVTLASWSLLVLLHAFALHRDALRQEAPTQLSDIVLTVAPPVVILALASCALAWAFARAADAMLRLPRLALLGTVFIALALPAAAASTVLVRMLADGAPLLAFLARLAQHGAFSWWVDACLSALAFLSQAAFAAWRCGQQQALAAEQAQTDSLALRLRLLQGQLKPHFLFNALNSISALVRTAERELAAQALGQLSELLRHVVHASRHSWLSVADEWRSSRPISTCSCCAMGSG